METMLLDYADKIATLTFNRPEKKNAFNEEMFDEFEHALREVAKRRDVSVLIIQGSGGAFSAGADVSPRPRDPGAPRGPRPDLLADRNNLEREIKRWMMVRDQPQPVIAAVQGHCFGLATQLCVMCDIVIVDEAANIGYPALPLGGGFISPVWTWVVGPSRAKYMSFRPGSTLTGKQAAEWGWATFAVPSADFDVEVQRTAQEIARVPLDLLEVKKKAVNRQMDVMGFSTGVTMGVEYDALLHESQVVKDQRGRIRELGLKGAIEEFRRG
jgi:enoyl-CoA hydratase